MSNLTRMMAALPFVAVTACGSDASVATGPAPTPDDAVVAAEGARLAGVAAKVTFDGFVVSPENPALHAFDLSIEKRCVRVSSSPDRDGDGFPADQTTTYACQLPESGGTRVLAGRMRIVDRNDRDPTSGFFGQFFGLSNTLVDPNGGRHIRAFDGVVSVDRGSNSPYVLDTDLTVTFTTIVHGGPFREVSTRNTAHVAYVPDPDFMNEKPFGAGTLTGEGLIELGSASETGGSVTIWHQRTAPTVHWNAACGGFDGGAIELTPWMPNLPPFPKNAPVLRVRYEGCGRSAATYAGLPL